MSVVISSCQKLSLLFFNKTYITHNLLQKNYSRFKSNKHIKSVGGQRETRNQDNTHESDLKEWEEIEGSESDFMNVHVSQREYERETTRRQHTVRVKMLERKYFKSKKDPALLTWEEREQMLHLHRTDPEKWNVHTLAESFPATEDVIEIILKAKWKPANAEKIDTYNKAVKNNWKMLYEGKLEISDKTRAHLAKFSSRKKITLPSLESYIVPTSETRLQPISREFSDIVKSSKPVELLTDPDQDIKAPFTRPLQDPPEDETYVIDESVNKKSQVLTTLDMYREKILRSGKPLDAIEKDMIDRHRSNLLENEKSVGHISSNDFAISKYDKQTTELESKPSVIREWVDIPHHLKGKGSLYKLNDCYYDEDGELLYRVPGMG